MKLKCVEMHINNNIQRTPKNIQQKKTQSIKACSIKVKHAYYTKLLHESS